MRRHERVDLTKCTPKQREVFDYIQTKGWEMYLAEDLVGVDDIFAEIQDLWDEYFPFHSADYGDDWWWTKRYNNITRAWGRRGSGIVINGNVTIGKVIINN